MPSISLLLKDPERRARFAATRAAVDKALNASAPTEMLSDSQIVDLVKQARRAKKEQ